MKDFIIDKELTDIQLKLLKEQKILFDEISDDTKIVNSVVKTNRDSKIVLEEGTLIHGTNFDKDKLISISKNGILASEFFGKIEDGETYYCADFYRVFYEQTIEEYYNYCTQPDKKGILKVPKIENSRLPIRTQESIAFIININYSVKRLSECDVYREDTEKVQIMKSIVNFSAIDSPRLYGSKERLSAILYGIPSNCLSGIWVGDKIIEDKEKIEFLKTNFLNCYITCKEGEILYCPDNTKNDKNNNFIDGLKNNLNTVVKDIDRSNKIDDKKYKYI